MSGKKSQKDPALEERRKKIKQLEADLFDIGLNSEFHSKTDLPELKNVNEFRTTYDRARKKMSALKRSKTPLLHTLGFLNIQKSPKKYTSPDFDQIPLVDEESSEADPEETSNESLFNKLSLKLGEKSAKQKIKPVSKALKILRKEVDQLDGLNKSIPFEPLGDPKFSVLRNLQKKHGFFDRSGDSTDSGTLQDVRSIRTALSKAREIDKKGSKPMSTADPFHGLRAISPKHAGGRRFRSTSPPSTGSSSSSGGMSDTLTSFSRHKSSSHTNIFDKQSTGLGRKGHSVTDLPAIKLESSGAMRRKRSTPILTPLGKN